MSLFRRAFQILWEWSSSRCRRLPFLCKLLASKVFIFYSYSYIYFIDLSSMWIVPLLKTAITCVSLDFTGLDFFCAWPEYSLEYRKWLHFLLECKTWLHFCLWNTTSYWGVFSYQICHKKPHLSVLSTEDYKKIKDRWQEIIYPSLYLL